MPAPRPHAEDDALGSLAEILQEQGYFVDLEEFGARRSGEPWLAGYAGLSVVAALSVYVLPLLTALLGVAAMVLHARDSEGRPLLRRELETGRNVVARAPAASRPALVVVAPASAAPRRFSDSSLRALSLALQAGMAAVAAGGAAAWIAEAEAELPAWTAACGAAAAASVGLLAIALYGSRARAAIEHGRVALDILARLAPELREEPVWLVVTGGRRAGMAGMQAFVAGHPETGGAWWLNLEPGSDPGVRAASEEGTWRERRADRSLLGAAEEAGAEVAPYRGVPTDATFLLAGRRRALTLVVGSVAEGTRVALATARAALARARL
ncbi:MAG: hypothetical protein ABR613_09990 [Actinomycetota bacterium]